MKHIYNLKWINFSIADTSVGIEEDKIEKLFEAFSQANSTSTREYAGTGLGLTISRSYIKMMGGHIHVTSVSGKRSNFRV